MTHEKSARPQQTSNSGLDPVDLENERISIILPHLNDLKGLDLCLRLLSEQSLSLDRCEIIVADNGSEGAPASVEAVVSGRARVLMVEQRGAGPARNAGVLASHGDIIVFIDSDCRPESLWLEKGVEALRQANVVGGCMIVQVDDLASPTATEAFETVFAFRNKRYVTKVGFTVTASMFMRRDVFDAVGPFENLVPEDVDWCRRARELGYTIGYAEEAVTRHPARKTMADLKRKWFRLTRESFTIVARQDLATQVLWLLRSWVVLLSIAPHLVILMFTPKLSSLRSRVLAAGALIQIRAYRFVISHEMFFKTIGR